MERSRKMLEHITFVNPDVITIDIFYDKYPRGTLAKVISGAIEQYNGNIVLRIDRGIINLSQNTAWANISSWNHYEVQVLPKEDVVKLSNKVVYF
jgi:hypothetical protein